MASTNDLRLSSNTKAKPSVFEKNSSTNKHHKKEKKKVSTTTTKTFATEEKHPSNFNWQSIVTLNEDPSVAKELRLGSSGNIEWDFSHVGCILENDIRKHQDSDFFLFGTSPFSYDNSTTGETGVCPTLGILQVPHGETPPQLVQVLNPNDATEEIVSFSEFGLVWKSFGNRGKYGDRVFALKQIHGTIDSKKLERAKLWNLMGSDLERKGENGKGELDIQKANFEFQKPNGEWIREPYSKRISSYKNICRMHGMVLKDDQGEPILHKETEELQVDPEQLSELKQAIKRDFVAARKEREEQIIMLEKNYPSFRGIESVKVFPQNEVIRQSYRTTFAKETAAASSAFLAKETAATASASFAPPPTSGHGTIKYINESYGMASRIFTNPNSAN